MAVQPATYRQRKQLSPTPPVLTHSTPPFRRATSEGREDGEETNIMMVAVVTMIMTMTMLMMMMVVMVMMMMTMMMMVLLSCRV